MVLSGLLKRTRLIKKKSLVGHSRSLSEEIDTLSLEKPQKLHQNNILLLDDIFDKLDYSRVEQLISFTSKGMFSQVFITDTHEERSKEILNKTGVDFNIFKIDNR